MSKRDSAFLTRVLSEAVAMSEKDTYRPPLWTNVALLIFGGLAGMLLLGQFSASMAIPGFFFGVAGVTLLIGRQQPFTLQPNDLGGHYQDE